MRQKYARTVGDSEFFAKRTKVTRAFDFDCIYSRTVSVYLIVLYLSFFQMIRVVLIKDEDNNNFIYSLSRVQTTLEIKKTKMSK